MAIPAGKRYVQTVDEKLREFALDMAGRHVERQELPEQIVHRAKKYHEFLTAGNGD